MFIPPLGLASPAAPSARAPPFPRRRRSQTQRAKLGAREGSPGSRSSCGAPTKPALAVVLTYEVGEGGETGSDRRGRKQRKSEEERGGSARRSDLETRARRARLLGRGHASSELLPKKAGCMRALVLGADGPSRVLPSRQPAGIGACAAATRGDSSPTPHGERGPSHVVIGAPPGLPPRHAPGKHPTRSLPEPCPPCLSPISGGGRAQHDGGAFSSWVLLAVTGAWPSLGAESERRGGIRSHRTRRSDRAPPPRSKHPPPPERTSRATRLAERLERAASSSTFGQRAKTGANPLLSICKAFIVKRWGHLFHA